MDVFESIVTGLQEAIDYEDNKITAKTTKITVKPLPDISAEEIRIIRNEAGLTQSVFAAVLGVSVKTVEAWEAGTNHPIGPARRMISLMQFDPSFIEKYQLVNQ